MVTPGRDSALYENPPPEQVDVQAGLAFKLMGFFAAIIVGALFFALLNPAVTQVLDFTSGMVASGGEASTSINRTQSIWGNILFYVVFVSLLTLIAAAVFERQGGM